MAIWMPTKSAMRLMPMAQVSAIVCPTVQAWRYPKRWFGYPLVSIFTGQAEEGTLYLCKGGLWDMSGV